MLTTEQILALSIEEVERLVVDAYPGWAPDSWATSAAGFLLFWKNVCEHIGNFHGCDGYVHLSYAQAAGHSLGYCQPVREFKAPEDDDEDEPWAAHLHVGIVCNDAAKVRGVWAHGARYCAQGRTPQFALGRAVLLALHGARCGSGEQVNVISDIRAMREKLERGELDVEWIDVDPPPIDSDDK